MDEDGVCQTPLALMCEGEVRWPGCRLPAAADLGSQLQRALLLGGGVLCLLTYLGHRRGSVRRTCPDTGTAPTDEPWNALLGRGPAKAQLLRSLLRSHRCMVRACALCMRVVQLVTPHLPCGL